MVVLGNFETRVSSAMVSLDPEVTIRTEVIKSSYVTLSHHLGT